MKTLNQVQFLITVSNESKSSLCDLRELANFRFTISTGNIIYGNEILDRTDAKINDNASDCSTETFRRRNMFFKDKGYLLNTDIFLSVEV